MTKELYQIVEAFPLKSSRSLVDRKANISDVVCKLLRGRSGPEGRATCCLLDEATSDLETAFERRKSNSVAFLPAHHIQDGINALQDKVTVVIIPHWHSTVKNADRYVLDEGRVIESGSHHEVRQQDYGQFCEMVELQSL